ncbi:aldehyde dehydrogenase family protein [Pseudomonas lactis]|uniref:aldehyde dehydrogenase family protein n=1 Tax=Pseudomonas lactis TaxID=1615674 RepID=UPI0039B0BD27
MKRGRGGDSTRPTPGHTGRCAYRGQPDRAQHLATQLQAGSVLINRISPELLAPFGGVKQSGVGREFGVFGLQAFLEAKSIVSD